MVQSARAYIAIICDGVVIGITVVVDAHVAFILPAYTYLVFGSLGHPAEQRHELPALLFCDLVYMAGKAQVCIDGKFACHRMLANERLLRRWVIAL